MLKNTFLSNLLLWVKLYIKEGLMSLIDFIVCLGSLGVRELFFVFFLFGCAFCCSLYTFCVL